MINFDYRGNVKVAILNHSKEKLSINCGDRTVQFILTRYETLRSIGIDDSDKTRCNKKGLISSGV